MKYRTKPVDVEAVQFDGTFDTAVKISIWGGDHLYADREESNIYLGHYCSEKNTCYHLEVYTITGLTRAYKDNWIVKGEFDQIWVVNNDEFKKNYESI